MIHVKVLFCSKFGFTYIRFLKVIAVLGITYCIPNTTASGTTDFVWGNSTIEAESTKRQLPEVPTNITVIPGSPDRGFLLLSAITINDTSIHYTRDLNEEISPFLLTNWNQSLLFLPSLDNTSEQGDLKLTNLLIGPIGNFSNFDNLLRETNSFRDLPIGVNTTIELPTIGVSFMLAELQVSRDISGIYYGNFDVLSDENSQIKDSKIAVISQFKSDGLLYDVTQKLVCNDLNKFGYDACK